MEVQRLIECIKDYVEDHALKCLAGAFILGAIMCGSFAGFMALTQGPAFCGSCHAMKEVTTSFNHSMHQNLNCTDCHLPHDSFTAYMVEKSRSGMYDLYHELLRDYPAVINLSAHGEGIVKKNCQRCHAATMKLVHQPVEGDSCLKCHRTVAHGTYRAEGGILIE